MKMIFTALVLSLLTNLYLSTPNLRKTADAWVSGTAYVWGSVVSEGGVEYQCYSTNHSWCKYNSPSYNSYSQWRTDIYDSNWVYQFAYSMGDIITCDNLQYKCIGYNCGGVEPQLDTKVPADWILASNYCEFDSSAGHAHHDVIYCRNKYYQCAGPNHADCASKNVTETLAWRYEPLRWDCSAWKYGDTYSINDVKSCQWKSYTCYGNDCSKADPGAAGNGNWKKAGQTYNDTYFGKPTYVALDSTGIQFFADSIADTSAAYLIRSTVETNYYSIVKKFGGSEYTFYFTTHEDRKAFSSRHRTVTEATINSNYLTYNNVKILKALFTQTDWNNWFGNGRFVLPDTTDDANRQAMYDYTSFLKGAARFPSVCEERGKADYINANTDDIDTVCKKELASMFAHMRQEIGGGIYTNTSYSTGQASYTLVSKTNQTIVTGECNIANSCGAKNCDFNYVREACADVDPPNCSAGYAQPSPLFQAVSGKEYYGRGCKQLSYNYNYGPFSLIMKGDENILLNNPELVHTDANLATSSAFWFTVTPQGSKPSMHEVMCGLWMPNAADVTRGHKVGFATTTNIINGGLECSSAYQANTGAISRSCYYYQFMNQLGLCTGTSCKMFEDEVTICPKGNAWIDTNDNLGYNIVGPEPLNFP